ncbi:MAG: serine/threonine-protein kinase [Pirellulaceae bacterium]
MTTSLHRPHAMPAAQPAVKDAAQPAVKDAAPRQGTSLPKQPAGQVGGWELHSLVGKGHWARVYAARTPGATSADYAVKVPRPLPPTSAPECTQAIAMLQREALIGTTVSHPHLAPVLDWQLRGEPFLVMPLLKGCTLRTLLQHRRREHGCLLGGGKFLPQSVWLARQVASALSALHWAGWLHGDVKPENVLVSPNGHGTLIDLGLARKLGSRECQGGEVLAGTLAYVSPESFLQSATLTAECDIYSLGVLLYELLTGQPLFEEADPTRLALLHLRQAPADIREAALDVPPVLARLVMQMLAKEPLRRPTAGEVVERLTRLEIELLGTT